MAVIKITSALFAQLMLDMAHNCEGCPAPMVCRNHHRNSRGCQHTLETYLTAKYGDGKQQEDAKKEIESWTRPSIKTTGT